MCYLGTTSLVLQKWGEQGFPYILLLGGLVPALSIDTSSYAASIHFNRIHARQCAFLQLALSGIVRLNWCLNKVDVC